MRNRHDATAFFDRWPGLRPVCRFLATLGLVIVLEAAPATAQSGWTPPVDLAASGGIPGVGVDAAGNAVAVWRETSGIRASHFSAVSGTWSTPVPLSPAGDQVFPPVVAMNAAGSAVAVWTNRGPAGSARVVEGAHFSAQTGQWSVPQTVIDASSCYCLVGIDAVGNAVVITSRAQVGFEEYLAVRYSPATGTWGSAAILAQTGSFPGVLLSVSANGDAVVTFEFQSASATTITARRYDSAAANWQGPITLASETTASGAAVFATTAAADESGRFLVAWTRGAGGVFAVQSRLFDAGTWTSILPAASAFLDVTVALGEGIGVLVGSDINGTEIWSARFDVASRTWGPLGKIGTAGLRPSGGLGSVPLTQVALTPGGDGVALWDAIVGSTYYARTTRYNRTTGQWSATTDLAAQKGPGQNIALAPDGAAVAGWVTPTNVTQVARYVAGSAAPVLAPAVVNRPHVSLSWTPPGAGPAPSSYTIVASLTSGGASVASLPVNTQTSFTVAAPDGTYYVRVVATVNGAPVPSNEIQVVVAPPALPSPPQNLMATVAGSVITFAWQAPSGSAVTGYVLEAGSGPGLSNLAVLPLGNVTSFVTPPVPNGSYYVRVRARNTSGTGPASSEVRAVVGPPPPSAPTLTGAGSAGGAVTLSWSVPASGAAVTGYQLQAGSAPGASNIAVIGLQATQTALATGGVPPGTYYVRVVATSAQGLGDFSNEITIVVP